MQELLDTQDPLKELPFGCPSSLALTQPSAKGKNTQKLSPNLVNTQMGFFAAVTRTSSCKLDSAFVENPVGQPLHRGG